MEDDGGIRLVGIVDEETKTGSEETGEEESGELL